MKHKFLALTALALLAACSSSEDKTIAPDYSLHGQMDNTREFGTIVSVDQDAHVAAHNMGTAATGLAGNAAGAAVGGSTLSSAGSWFTSGSEDPSVGMETALHYVIRKDDGTIINVVQTPEIGDAVLYPGQRAMIQHNGQFVRVYSGDVEHSRGGS